MKEIQILGKEPRHFKPMNLEDPGVDDEIHADFGGDSKKVVDWINGKVRERDEERDNWPHSMATSRVVGNKTNMR